jgi:hypothetical protein
MANERPAVNIPLPIRIKQTPEIMASHSKRKLEDLVIHRWTDLELSILEENYNTIGALKTSKLLPGRTLVAVTCKANLLESHKPRQPSVGPRALKLRHRFGITIEEYETKWEEQNGVCAICGNPETELHQNGQVLRLAVDHNHTTKQNRDLLCRSCNLMIANAKESISTLSSAIKYLEKHNGR